MKKIALILSLVAAAIVLSGCGGGGGEGSDAPSNSVTAQCKSEGDTISVTQTGCTTRVDNQDYSMACKPDGKFFMLTGTGKSLEQIFMGLSLTSGGPTVKFNGRTLTCS